MTLEKKPPGTPHFSVTAFQRDPVSRKLQKLSSKDNQTAREDLVCESDDLRE